MKAENEEYDLAGLDETWQGSPAEEQPDTDSSSDSDVIPQLDGQADEKPKCKWAASSKFVSSSTPSRHILTAHAQPFRGARDQAFCLKVYLDSLLV